MDFARKVAGENTPLPGSGAALLGTRLRCWCWWDLGLGRFEFLEPEFELLYLSLDLLRTSPELHASQLGDQQFQMFDLGLVGDQLCMLQTDHRLQRCGVESLQIRQERLLTHARSMPCPWGMKVRKPA